MSRCFSTYIFYYSHLSLLSSFESLQVHLNLHFLMTFEHTSIYVHISINRSIVERMLDMYLTTNSYEIKVFPLHPT